MIKNIQTKIILIFFLLSIIVIGTLSFLHINMLEKMIELTQSGRMEVQVLIQEQITQTKIITIIAIGIFSIITLIVSYFISKTVVNPKTILIQNAEKIARGEVIEKE